MCIRDRCVSAQRSSSRAGAARWRARRHRVHRLQGALLVNEVTQRAQGSVGRREGVCGFRLRFANAQRYSHRRKTAGGRRER
eukprot:2625223-Pleurochrysis_carterae.AAC.3